HGVAPTTRVDRPTHHLVLCCSYATNSRSREGECNRHAPKGARQNRAAKKSRALDCRSAISIGRIAVANRPLTVQSKRTSSLRETRSQAWMDSPPLASPEPNDTQFLQPASQATKVMATKNPD